MLRIAHDYTLAGVPSTDVGSDDTQQACFLCCPARCCSAASFLIAMRCSCDFTALKQRPAPPLRTSRTSKPCTSGQIPRVLLRWTTLLGKRLQLVSVPWSSAAPARADGERLLQCVFWAWLTSTLRSRSFRHTGRTATLCAALCPPDAGCAVDNVLRIRSHADGDFALH